MRLIVSTAHEVAQVLPLASEQYTCLRCGTRGSLTKLFSSEAEHRCVPHFETEASGWIHDANFSELETACIAVGKDFQ